MGEQTQVTTLPQVSFFEPRPNGKVGIKPTRTVSIEQVIQWTRDGGYAAQVADVRKAQNKAEKDYFKKQLPFVTWSGTFAPQRLESHLQTHSGFIAFDFDNNPDPVSLKLQLQTDPYVMVCFISPSGNGVKAVVAIKDKEKHRETFADAAYYFNNVYRLTNKSEMVDVSGSDPSRACFISHDPEIYYDPAKKIYAIQNLVPPKPKTERQLAQDASNTEKHVAAVVERLEQHSLDICNDYGTEWLLIAFSLSTLGENGRQYFHRVSALNDKYNEADADKKFDNALQTSRFTTAAKFFSICQDYGEDISRPKKDVKKTTAPKLDDLPFDQRDKLTEAENEELDKLLALGKSEKVTNGYKEKPAKKERKKRERNEDYDYEEETVWYTFNGGMKIKGGKYWDDVASNFQIYIKYRTEDEQENVTWVLEIRKNNGESEFMEVIHDDFCSARKLKNTLATKRLGFKIKDGHLDELHSYLFTKTNFATAMKVVRYGFHPESKVYFFANKALNLKTNEMMAPDSFGIVQANGLHLSIPQQAKQRQLRYTLTDQSISFAKFWNLYATCHLYENAFVPVCFYIFSLFRDIGLKHKNFSPILFLKGGAGTGKSSMVRILTAAFGRKQEGVNLKSKNTDAALVKLMSQTSNSIIWFDEFHNELPNEGLLQAAYDNDGYHKSTTDFNSIDTATVEIHSALALTSNYLPENEIFFSRCVFIPISDQKKVETQIKAYNALGEIEDGGLGQMTIELLKHRQVLEANDNYAVSYNRLYNALKNQYNGQTVPERLFANMAQIMAAPYTMHCMGLINMLPVETTDEREILEGFVEIGEKFITRQFRIQNESKAIAEFFEMIQMLFESHQIHEELHFRFHGNQIMLNFRKLYNLFSQKYRLTFHKSPPDRDTIQSELSTLAGVNDWEDLSKPVRFANDGSGTSIAKTIPQPGSCVLEYSLLTKNFGLNLEKRTGSNN